MIELNTLNILGYSYTIKRFDRLKEDANSSGGSCDNQQQIIWVDTQKHFQYQESTMIHEIIEAVNLHLNIGLNESQICQLETGLYQTLNQNGMLK